MVYVRLVNKTARERMGKQGEDSLLGINFLIRNKLPY